jgi:hypothetical protein
VAPVGCVTVGEIARVCAIPNVTALGEADTLVTAAGACSTVIVAEPTTPSTVAVIVAVPTATPVTIPVPLTDAAAAFSVAQLTVRPVSTCPAESRTVATNGCVEPVSTLAFPGATSTEATAAADTVTVMVAVLVVAAKPVFAAAVAVTVIVAVPGATAAITPAADTVATLGAVVP